MKKKKLIKTISIIAAAAILASAVAVGVISAERKNGTSYDPELLGGEQTKYMPDELFRHVSNIPYDDYKVECSLPKDAKTVEGLKGGLNYFSNTEILQNEIDELSDNGGGTLYIPAGEYCIDTITLKSNIMLFLDPGCMLSCLSRYEMDPKETASGVFYAKDAKNIVITGGGTINCYGETFLDEPEVSEPFYPLREFSLQGRIAEAGKRVMRELDGVKRLRLFNFSGCEHIEISSLVISDPALTGCTFSSCDAVTVKNVVIDGNFRSADTCGLVFNGGKGIIVDHCFITSGGDGVCLRSTSKSLVSVTVSDCEICSFSDCFRIGDKTNYNIQNIKLKDCSFFVPGGLVGAKTGISIESADGSKISGVDVSGIEMDGVSSPMLIWLGNRLDSAKKEVGSIHDVSVSGISAKNVELPAAITGCRAKNVYDISVENFEMTYRDTAENLSVKAPAPTGGMKGMPGIENVSYSSGFLFVPGLCYSLPCCGLYVRYAENVSTDGFECIPRTSNTLETIYEEKS